MRHQVINSAGIVHDDTWVLSAERCHLFAPFQGMKLHIYIYDSSELFIAWMIRIFTGSMNIYFVGEFIWVSIMRVGYICITNTRRCAMSISYSERTEEVSHPLQWRHYRAMASQITGVRIVYVTFCSSVDQRKHQSSAPLGFVRGIYRWPVNSPHKSASNAENVSIWWRHHDRRIQQPSHGVHKYFSCSDFTLACAMRLSYIFCQIVYRWAT